MPGSPDAATDEELARLLIRVVGAAVAFLFASSVGLAVQQADETTMVAAPASSVGPIGPLPGTDIGRYAVAGRDRLAALQARAAAVVSFAAYVDEAEARALARRSGVEVVALLVAVPNGEPRAVTEDLKAFVADERQRAEAERDELAGVLETTTDPDFVTQYEEDIARLDRLVQRIASAGDIVFGLVVRGRADALRALAADPEVRLVDVGEGTGRPPLDSVRGLRPEETTRAGDPRSRPDLA